MFAHLRQYLAPPVFADEATTRASGLLNAVLLTLMASAIVTGLAQVVRSPQPVWPAALSLSMVVLCLVLRQVMNRGQVQLAGHLLMAGIVAAHQLSAYTRGGVFSTGFAASLLVITLVCLILGVRAAFIYTGLYIVSSFILAYLATQQWIPAPSQTPWAAWLQYAGLLIAQMALLALALRPTRHGGPDMTGRPGTEGDLRQKGPSLDITQRKRAEQENARLVYDLKERVKELTALHAVARVFQEGQSNTAELLKEIVALVPPAWQYPEITAARLTFAGEEAQTPNFIHTPWVQRAEFATPNGQPGELEVVYLQEKPPMAEGPFLAEERSLINSLADILRLHFERKQAEAALRESEERFRSLADVAFEGIMVHEQGLILDANDAFARINGFRDRVELIGRHGLEVLPLTPESKEIIQARVRSNSTDPYEIAILRPDGSTFPAEMQARDANYRGHKARVVAMRDITARKQYEAALHRYTSRLEILHEIDRAILGARSPEETALAALTRVRRLIPSQRASVTLFDFQSEQASLLAISVEGRTHLLPGSGMTLVNYGLRIIEVLKQGSSYVIEDLESETARPAINELLVKEGLRAWMATPLLYQDQLIGSLNLSRSEPGPFAAEHVEITREIADQLAIAIRQAQLHAATQRRVRELAGLQEIAQAFSKLTDVREMYGVLVERIGRLIGAQRCAIMLIGEDGFMRAQAPGYGIADEDLVHWQWQVVDDELRLGALAQGYLLLPSLEAVEKAARLRGTSLRGENLLAVSLRIEGEEAGLVILTDKPGEFDAEDIQLLTVFGAQAGVVIENSRLYERERAARLRADTLVEVTRAVSSTLSLHEVLLRILQESARVLPFISGSITVYEDGMPTLMALAGHEGREEIVMQVTQDYLKNSPILQRLLNDRQALIIPDVHRDPDWVRHPATDYIRSWMGIPLVAQNRVIGALSLDSDQPRSFTSQHLATAQALAAQAAIAIENARLFAAEHQARERAEVLRAATAAITQSLDLGQVLESILDHLSRLVPFDGACVFLIDNGSHATVRAIRGYERGSPDDHDPTGLGFAMTRLPALQRVVESQTSILIPDTTEDPGWVQVDDGKNVQSWIGVPLIAEGRVFGIYSLDKARPHFFTEAHLRLAEGLSAQGAIAIHNARLFEQVRVGQDQLHALSQRLVEVQEEERRHLARELHDEVGQMLTGLKLMLGVLPRLPAEALNARVAEAMAVLNTLTEQVHRLSLNLRPVILDDLGLTSALLWLFERFTSQTGVQINFEAVGIDRRFPPRVETTAYRIVQEALTNVARHAGVSQASVRIRVETGWLRLQIQDSGRGFDMLSMLTSRQRAGLAGMRERAALLGGQLQVDSAPGTGTQLIVTLPIE